MRETADYLSQTNLFAKPRNEWVHCYNPGQNIVDKLTKLSKMGFSMECFTDDFVFICHNLSLGWPLRTHHRFQAFQRFFWNFITSYDRNF